MYMFVCVCAQACLIAAGRGCGATLGAVAARKQVTAVRPTSPCIFHLPPQISYLTSQISRLTSQGVLETSDVGPRDATPHSERSCHRGLAQEDADDFAADLGCAKAYGGDSAYADLCADPDIDICYVGTHHTHTGPRPLFRADAPSLPWKLPVGPPRVGRARGLSAGRRSGRHDHDASHGARADGAQRGEARPLREAVRGGRRAGAQLTVYLWSNSPPLSLPCCCRRGALANHASDASCPLSGGWVCSRRLVSAAGLAQVQAMYAAADANGVMLQA